MTPESGRWVKTATGWVDTNTGFTSAVDPTYAPPGINLPRVGSQTDYQRWEAERSGTPQARAQVTNPQVSLNQQITQGNIPAGTQLNTAVPPVSTAVPPAIAQSGNLPPFAQAALRNAPNTVTPTLTRSSSGGGTGIATRTTLNPNADRAAAAMGIPPPSSPTVTPQLVRSDAGGGTGTVERTMVDAGGDAATRFQRNYDEFRRRDAQLAGPGQVQSGGSIWDSYGFLTPDEARIDPGVNPVLYAQRTGLHPYTGERLTDTQLTQLAGAGVQLGSGAAPGGGGAGVGGSGPVPGGGEGGTGGTGGGGAASGLTLSVRHPLTDRIETVSGDQLGYALNAGWRPLDESGTPFDMRQVPGGGWVAATDQGWVPINVLQGGDWLPGQQDALSGFLQNNDLPQLPTPASGTAPSGAQYAFGSLLEPFDQPFTGKGVYESVPFTKPFDFTYEDFYESPAFKHRMEQGAKAIERSAAAAGRLFGGRTGKELTRFAQGEASQEFERQYGRELGEYMTDYGIHQDTEANRRTDYGQAFNEWLTNRDIFRGNQQDIFGRLSTLAGYGPASALGGLGSEYARQASGTMSDSRARINDLLTGGASAQAGGVVGAAGARAGGFGGAISNVQDFIMMRNLGLI